MTTLGLVATRTATLYVIRRDLCDYTRSGIGSLLTGLANADSFIGTSESDEIETNKKIYVQYGQACPIPSNR